MIINPLFAKQCLDLKFYNGIDFNANKNNTMSKFTLIDFWSNRYLALK